MWSFHVSYLRPALDLRVTLSVASQVQRRVLYLAVLCGGEGMMDSDELDDLLENRPMSLRRRIMALLCLLVALALAVGGSSP